MLVHRWVSQTASGKPSGPTHAIGDTGRDRPRLPGAMSGYRRSACSVRVVLLVDPQGQFPYKNQSVALIATSGWDIVTAIGTLAAAVVALGIAVAPTIIGQFRRPRI